MVCARVDKFEWHIHVGNILGNIRARFCLSGFIVLTQIKQDLTFY